MLSRWGTKCKADGGPYAKPGLRAQSGGRKDYTGRGTLCQSSVSEAAGGRHNAEHDLEACDSVELRAPRVKQVRDCLLSRWGTVYSAGGGRYVQDAGNPVFQRAGDSMLSGQGTVCQALRGQCAERTGNRMLSKRAAAC